MWLPFVSTEPIKWQFLADLGMGWSVFQMSTTRPSMTGAHLSATPIRSTTWPISKTIYSVLLRIARCANGTLRAKLALVSTNSKTLSTTPLCIRSTTCCLQDPGIKLSEPSIWKLVRLIEASSPLAKLSIVCTCGTNGSSLLVLILWLGRMTWRLVRLRPSRATAAGSYPWPQI